MPATKKKAKPAKVRVTICLDPDVIEFFKKRARSRGAPPYQTQINTELRAVMEGGSIGSYDSLLGDERFIAAVAEQVLKLSRKGSKK